MTLLNVSMFLGQSSAPVEPIDVGLLRTKGFLFLTRPSLMHYAAARDDLVAHAQDLFEVVISGVVTIRIHKKYALQDTALAHKDHEARKTFGSTIFLP